MYPTNSEQPTNPVENSPRQSCRKAAVKLPPTAETPTVNPYRKMADADAKRYRRQRDLPPLLALWPHELEDYSQSGTRLIVERLEVALRAERRRGRARHWCYDLNRHAGLISALKAERTHLLECDFGTEKSI